ncbi:MAG: SH3 domain-containing protein [Caldilineaceae bacterium]|nr:SH3 domain-containing protein [Caldilineaceae bacterium]
MPLREATATPTATSTPTATPTATPTPTPTVEGNGQGNGQGNQPGNSGGNQPGNSGGNQGNNQGRSNNQGGNNQGGNKQGGVNVQSFISNPTPLPSYSPQQYQAPLAITIPEIMNVRSGPGLTYDIVTTVPAGTQGTIVGIDPDNDWYQVEIEGIEGQVWVYQDLTTLVGSLVGVKQYTALEIAQLTTGTPSTDGSVPLAITIPELMNVRTGPGLIYDIVTTVPAGTQGYIYGIDPDNDWFQIELEGFDTRVWVYQDLTTVVGSLAAVKLYTAAEIALLLSGSGADGSIPLAITVPITMNVRTGPGLLYDVVGIVPKGTQGRIFGIDPNNDWFQIELEAFDTLVWVYQDLTTVIGSLAGVKWVTEAELALLPAAITQPLLLNARAGPGLTYDILTTIPQGTWMKIVGIDTLGEWYRVELPDLNQQAWIFRDYTKVAGGSLSGLIQLALGGAAPAAGQLTSSITVALSLPPAGGVDLEVSWVDVRGCAHLYNLYHRASTDSTVYISLEQAATSSTANSQSLSFSSLSGSSFISAWCGSMAAGREVAEVEIDPGVAGTYSSTTTSGGLAAVPDIDDSSR